MNYSGSRPESAPTSDSGALPQFRLSSDPLLDDGDAAETLERPPVRVVEERRPFKAVPPCGATLVSGSSSDSPEDPPTIVKVHADQLASLLEDEEYARVETYADGVWASSPPRPPSARRETMSSLAPVAIASVATPSTPPPPSVEAPAEPLVSVPPARSSQLRTGLVSFSVAMIAGMAVGLALLPGGRERVHAVAASLRPAPPPATVDAPPPAPVVVAPPPVATIDPAPVLPEVAPPPAPSIAPDKSVLVFQDGRRVWVDGRLVKSGVPLACGKHSLRVGGSGKARLTVLPCGSALSID